MITVSEIDTHIRALYTSKELENIDWANISEADKEVYKAKAEGKLNEFRYRGRLAEIGQKNQFPRKIDGVIIGINDRVKNALASIVYDLIESQGGTRRELQRQGVKSISTAGVSETYVETGSKGEYVEYINKYLFKGVI